MKMAHKCDNDNVVEDSLSGSSNDSDLVLKRNTKAFIWKYFEFEPNEKGNPRSKNHLKCCLCRLEITANDGNTSNLYSHLRTNILRNMILCKRRLPTPAGNDRTIKHSNSCSNHH